MPVSPPCLTHSPQRSLVLALLPQLHLISVWRGAVLHNTSSSYSDPFLTSSSAYFLLAWVPSLSTPFSLFTSVHAQCPLTLLPLTKTHLAHWWYFMQRFLLLRCTTVQFVVFQKVWFRMQGSIPLSLLSFFPHLHLSSSATLPPLYSPSHPSFQSQALASCLSWPPQYFVSLAHDPSNYISHHMLFTLCPNPPPLLINVFFSYSHSSCHDQKKVNHKQWEPTPQSISSALF